MKVINILSQGLRPVNLVHWLRLRARWSKVGIGWMKDIWRLPKNIKIKNYNDPLTGVVILFDLWSLNSGKDDQVVCTTGFSIALMEENGRLSGWLLDIPVCMKQSGREFRSWFNEQKTIRTDFEIPCPIFDIRYSFFMLLSLSPLADCLKFSFRLLAWTYRKILWKSFLSWFFYHLFP